MRIQGQVIIEWTISNRVSEFSFSQRLEKVISNQNQPLKEGETLEIHQINYIGEFNNEKVYIIILNIVQKSG